MLVAGAAHGRPPEGAASPWLFALPSGLCLVPVTRGQHGPLPRPSLQAQPSALVPLDTPVTLRCRGPLEVDLYRLEQLGTEEYSNQDALIIPAMSRASAGRYRCSYQNGSRWSPPSEHLELVATGVFAKPLLTAIPGPAVSLGEDVTLQCRTQYGFDHFALYKEGQARLQRRPGKWYQANFPIVTVTAAHSGTYRCYSFSSASPHLWSAPSDPLELTVTGIPVATRQSPAEPPPSTTEPSRNSTDRLEGAGSPADRARPSYAPGNLVRLGLGALLLLLLAALLAEDWHSRRQARRPRVRALLRPLPPLPRAS
ncbi:platelet glycoprotein VI isoform X1 [Oryctolagus cuniculus]|uniref:platelet glycoprotein VI isoform X1 n=1 Tax=Oryctolagus cuniculus TaxID=9986 RepID=UPI00387A5AD4